MSKPREELKRGQIVLPEGLHLLTASLVCRFAVALAEKLRKAEMKYDYRDGWALDDWQDECREHLLHHIAKGDPLDVAAYCAFMWHHGWSTAATAEVVTNEMIDAAATVEQCARVAETCLIKFSIVRAGILQDQIDVARKDIAAAIRSLIVSVIDNAPRATDTEALLTEAVKALEKIALLRDAEDACEPFDEALAIADAALFKIKAETEEASSKTPGRSSVRCDDPEMDGTDGAHPAWWRGNDAGVVRVVQIVNEILDGKQDGGAFGYEPLNALRERLQKQAASYQNARSEIERLREDCSEFYQIIGALAVSHGDLFATPEVTKALDNAGAAAAGEPSPLQMLEKICDEIFERLNNEVVFQRKRANDAERLWKADCESWGKARALLTEAVKALEPFAALAASVDGSPYTSPFGDSCPLSVIPSAEPNSGTASLGDCRRAHATLSKIKAEAK